MEDFSDIKEAQVGNTRNGRSLDRIFLNLSRSVIESGTLEPLATEETDNEEARSSDHRVAYCRLDLPRRNTFTWETYTYRYFNEESKKNFKAWIVMHDWQEVLAAEGSNNKADAYQNTLNAAMDWFFPWKTIRRRSNDLPWINKAVIKRIEARKRLYWSEGGKRTALWREEQKKTADLIKSRKKEYRDTQKSHLPVSWARRCV